MGEQRPQWAFHEVPGREWYVGIISVTACHMLIHTPINTRLVMQLHICTVESQNVVLVHKKGK